jgi:hypothetical protein
MIVESETFRREEAYSIGALTSGGGVAYGGVDRVWKIVSGRNICGCSDVSEV